MPTPIEHFQRFSLNRKGFRSRKVPTRAGTMHVMDGYGSGDLGTIVLLHGLGTTGVFFGPFLSCLRRHFSRLIVPDVPAHGFSDIPLRGPNMDSIAEGLLDSLDRVLQGQPATIYGNSMGGFATIRFALERPNIAKRIVLCSPGGAAMTQSAFDEMQRQFHPKSHGEALDFIDRLFTKHYRTRHLLAFGARRSFSRRSIQELLASIDTERFLTAEEVAGLEMPILFIWGGEERILPDRNLAFFEKNLPEHTRIWRPPEFGHSPHLEYPRQLSNEIVDFVRASSAVAQTRT